VLPDLLSLLDGLGAFETIVPFFVVFLVVFGAINHIGFFQNKRGIEVVLASIAGLFFIRNQFLVGIMLRFFTNISYFIFLLLILLFGFGLIARKKAKKGIFLFVGFIVSISYIFFALSDKTTSFLGGGSLRILSQLPSNIVQGILFIVLFGAIIFWAMKGKSKNKTDKR